MTLSCLEALPNVTSFSLYEMLELTPCGTNRRMKMLDNEGVIVIGDVTKVSITVSVLIIDLHYLLVQTTP